MDFTFPEEITALRASFSDFVKRQIMPLEEELASEFESLSPDRQRIVEAMDRVRALSVEAGFFAAHAQIGRRPGAQHAGDDRAGRGRRTQRLAPGDDRDLTAEPGRTQFLLLKLPTT